MIIVAKIIITITIITYNNYIHTAALRQRTTANSNMTTNVNVLSMDLTKWVRILKDCKLKHNKYITNIINIMQIYKVQEWNWLRKADQLPFIRNSLNSASCSETSSAKLTCAWSSSSSSCTWTGQWWFSNWFNHGSTMFNLWAWIATGYPLCHNPSECQALCLWSWTGVESSEWHHHFRNTRPTCQCSSSTFYQSTNN